MNLPYNNKVVGAVLETSEKTILSCPEGKQIVIKSINFSNVTSDDVFIYVKLKDSSAEQEYYLANGVVVYDDTSFELVSNLINLEESDEIIIRASSNDSCHVVISYLEISS